ncbi:MAG TPA: DUF362 domain-containing protein [Candidatus Aphodomonas merdavium]|nr:DUF362 domain-containing protein [Candidatus Aphodomonas merdavium]
MEKVAVAACTSYDPQEVLHALEEAIVPIGGLDFVKPGMRVAVKVNLITAMRPQAAATTHPAVAAAMVRLLSQRGASVVIGDSPGGPFMAANVLNAYRASGMKAVEEAGGSLNRNFDVVDVAFPQGVAAKRFAYTAWLSQADAIVDLCKLKTHGMMTMTAAVKNMFGAIPGLEKAAYHCRYSNRERFAQMLVDLCAYSKPVLSVADAVVAMEGNGPTQGKPRAIGALLASTCPHSLDLACAHLIGLTPGDVPTLSVALQRGLIGQTVRELEIIGDLERFVCPNFDVVRRARGIAFYSSSDGDKKGVLERVARVAVEMKPGVTKEQCTGCGKCASVCPVHAIAMRAGTPHIDRKTCIRCFCCQEFCPAGAMKAKRSVLARILQDR